jgi:hypothetical protein
VERATRQPEPVSRRARKTAKNRPRVLPPRRKFMPLDQIIREARSGRKGGWPALVECQGEPDCVSKIEPHRIICGDCGGKQPNKTSSTNPETSGNASPA